MPAPELHGPCTFYGIAAEVHVRGEGAAVLLEPALSAHGQIDLEGAQVGGSRRNLHFDHPAHLEPVGMNPESAPYDVTYHAGPPLIVDIVAGGKNGNFKGDHPDAPGCAARWCAVVWAAQTKNVKLRLDDGDLGPISGRFPFGEARSMPDTDGGAPRPALVQQITLTNATGTLHCEDGVQPIQEGTWSFSAGPHQSLSIEPIRRTTTKDRLEVNITNESPPVRLNEEPPVPAGHGLRGTTIGAGAAILVTAAAVGLVLLRRRQQRGARTLEVFVAAAPEDQELTAELEKHLLPLERQRVLWIRRVGAGHDWRREVEARMGDADLILLLVSSDFAASDGFSEMLPRALERHAQGQARVIPVILRAYDWTEEPYGKLDPLPRGGAPVTDTRAWPTRDAAFKAIAEGIKGEALALSRRARAASG